MNGPAKFEVPAEADGKPVQPPLLPVDGQQIGKGLGGVVVSAVPGVDDGDLAELGGGEGGALLGVAHGDDVGVAADGVDGIPHGLPLGGGAGGGLREAQDASPQGQHGGLKGEAGPGGRLEKEGGQLLVGAGGLVFGGARDNVLRRGDQFVDFLHGEVGDVDDVSGHRCSFPKEGHL